MHMHNVMQIITLQVVICWVCVWNCIHFNINLKKSEVWLTHPAPKNGWVYCFYRVLQAIKGQNVEMPREALIKWIPVSSGGTHGTN